MKRRDVIESEYREEGNYWIELRPGYQNGLDPGTHAICEGTKREAYAALSSVKPCACAECLGLGAKAAASAAASALGRLGGLTKSPARARASAKNGLLGGRPRKDGKAPRRAKALEAGR